MEKKTKINETNKITLFMKIRNMEAKNIKTGKYTDQQMRNKIIKLIEKEV